MTKRPAVPFAAILLGLGLATSVGPAPASASAAELFSPQSFTGLIDLRAAGADGERSWLDGGFGKFRFGGDGSGSFQGDAAIADAALAWKPRLSWDLSAVVDGEVQRTDGYHADLIQAYLVYKPVPRGDTRYQVRVGLFYPPISQEHEGATWDVADTITPSAINSWVGEEVKVAGAEATVSHRFGGHEISATGAVFGDNDTSGTLLTFRGWGFNDVKAGAIGSLPLPPLNPAYMIGQPPETYAAREVDKRIGYYAKLDWRPPGKASFNAFYYNNNGNEVGVDKDGQWAWATQFWNLGARLQLDDQTHVLSQVMTGQTLMGFPNGRSVWYNIGFTSAYLLAAHSEGRSTFTGRVDYFETSDRNFRPLTDGAEEDWSEKGWAITGAYHFNVSSHANLYVEALHSQSDRPSRLQSGIPRKQLQTLLQTSLRLTF